MLPISTVETEGPKETERERKIRKRKDHLVYLSLLLLPLHIMGFSASTRQVLYSPFHLSLLEVAELMLTPQIVTILLIHSCFCVAVPPVVVAIAIWVWDGSHPACLCNWVSSQMTQSNPEKFHPSNSPGLALLPLLLVFHLAVSLKLSFL